MGTPESVRILLTNDDGIHAEGLVSLERIARAISDDIWICAPEYEQSGASRSLTLAEPLRVRRLDDRRFATTGTPTDCVMLAVTELMGSDRPDLVLSGVNRGANLAEDVTMSGTVAGAIEGMALGIPSIALSQMSWPTPGEEMPDQPVFEPAEHFGPGIVRRLVEIGWPSDVVMNVNFPSRALDQIREVEVTRQTFRDLHVRQAVQRTDPRGEIYYWMGFRRELSAPAAGTDLRAIYDGRISVTPLHIDLTHQETVHRMRAVLGGAPPKA
jgi:5'-nucleotidase